MAAATLANNAADAAVEIGTLAQITGASVEDTSRLAQVWKTTGADVKDLADVVAQVNGVLADTPELARQLGIELEGANPQQVFIEAVEAVNQLSNSQERLVTGARLFGEEGVRQVAAVNARYQDLSTAIATTDPMFTADDVQAAIDMKQSLADVQAAAGRMAAELGQSLIPALEGLAEALGPVADIAGPVLEFFNGLKLILDPVGNALGLLSGDVDSFIDRIYALPGGDSSPSSSACRRWRRSRTPWPMPPRRPTPRPPRSTRWRSGPGGRPPGCPMSKTPPAASTTPCALSSIRCSP